MSAQASRIRWNSLFAFLSQLIRLLTNFFLFVGIARFYGPEAFGQFTTAHTFSTIFLLFADFGFDMLLTTEIARQRESAEQLARTYYSLKLLFAFCAALAMFALSLVQSFTSETMLLIQIFSLYVLFSSLNNFFFALFKGVEQFQHETKISFGINLLLLLLMIIGGIARVPLPIIALFFVGSRIIGLIIGARIALRLTRFYPMSIDFTGWKDVWRLVSVFGLQYIFGNLFFILDTVLLAFWNGDRDVSVYQAAFKIVVLALIIPDIVINTLMPMLSRVHGESEERWDSLGRLLNKTLFLIGLPICMILFVYAEQIIEIVYGGRIFTEAVPILRLFAFTVLVRFSVETYALMLTTSRRQTARAMIVVGGTVVNFLMNLILIPKLGPYGAAIVSLATNIIVGTGYVIMAHNFIARWRFDKRKIVPFVTTVILALIIWQLRTIPLWYTGPVAIGIYALVFYFVGYTKDEWDMIFSRVKHASVI